MEVIQIYREDVIAYGYFTTDNPETAQLIANSTFLYVTNPPTMYVEILAFRSLDQIIFVLVQFALSSAGNTC